MTTKKDNGTKAKPKSSSVKAKAAKLKAEIGELLAAQKAAKEAGDDAEVVRCKNELRIKRPELGKLWDDNAVNGELP